jgi:hypothetical protein
MHVINTPTVIEDEFRTSFGLIVTPVKKTPEDYRNWRITYPTTARRLLPDEGNENVSIRSIWRTHWSRKYELYPGGSGEENYPLPASTTAPDQFSGIVDGVKYWTYPYYQLGQQWVESPQFKIFGDEWVNDMRRAQVMDPNVPVRDRVTKVSQNSRSLQDFILWGFKQLRDKGDVRGMYFDVSGAVLSDNVYAGDGVVTPEGVEKKLALLGTRHLLRRIAILYREKYPDSLIWFHNSGRLVMPVLSWADALCDGENYTTTVDKTTRGYESFFTLDTVKAEYMCQNNMGPVSVFLPEFDRGGAIVGKEWEEVGPQPAEYILGMLLLHDSTLWYAYIYDKAVSKLWHALAEAKFGHQYEFIPYWNQTVTQRLDENDIVASFYVDKKAKRTLMILMNMNGMPEGIPRKGPTKSFSLTIDFGKLGLNAANVRARNACHDERAALSGNVLKMTFPSYSYRMIVLEER